MPRPKIKHELITASGDTFAKLWQLIDGLDDNALTANFDFGDNPKLSEAHWQRDKNIKDVLIHVYEWHRLLINWIDANQSGKGMPFLPEPYNWTSYQAMNTAFVEKHQQTTYEQATVLLKESHNEVMKRIDGFSDEELFTKKYFPWTGTTSLGSYCISSTSSHYDWAIKKLRKHKKTFRIK